MRNQFKSQKFKHLMLAMGPRDLNSAPYSPVHCSSHSMTSFQSSELTELPVVENGQLFAQRAHSARTAHGTPPQAQCQRRSPHGAADGGRNRLRGWAVFLRTIFGLFVLATSEDSVTNAQKGHNNVCPFGGAPLAQETSQVRHSVPHPNQRCGTQNVSPSHGQGQRWLSHGTNDETQLDSQAQHAFIPIRRTTPQPLILSTKNKGTEGRS